MITVSDTEKVLTLLFLYFSEVDKKHKSVESQLNELTNMLKKMQTKVEGLTEEKLGINSDLDKKISTLADKEHEYHILMKDFEYAKEREAMLLGDK